MNPTQLLIIMIFAKYSTIGRDAYTEMSIDKLLFLLQARHNKSIKRWMAFKHIRGLVEKGYLFRKPRTILDKDNFPMRIPSCYLFTEKGAWEVRKLDEKRGDEFLDVIAKGKKKTKKQKTEMDAINVRRLEILAETILKPFPVEEKPAETKVTSREDYLRQRNAEMDQAEIKLLQDLGATDHKEVNPASVRIPAR